MNLSMVVIMVFLSGAAGLFGQSEGSNGSGGVDIRGTITYSLKGKIYLDLLNQQGYEGNKPGGFHQVITPQEQQTKVDFLFTQVPEGSYVLVCYQDLNGNGLLDWNWFHPTEPAAMFRPGQPFLGMPRFADVKFEVDSSISHVTLILKTLGE